MNAVDLKRVEFRLYLETTGVMDALSYALIKLYDEIPKPTDPVAFVRQHFKLPTDTHKDTECAQLDGDFDGKRLIDKQQHELDLARQEIAKLRETLNVMANDSGKTNNGVIEEPDEHPLFNDSRYDGTALKQHLVKDQFDALCETYGKSTITDLIVNADELNRYPTGLYLSSSECYTKFATLIDPILMDIHNTQMTAMHPAADYGDATQFQRLQCDSIDSIEVSCSRSLRSFPFVTGMSEQDLENILSMVQDAIQSKCSPDDDIDGEFYKITDVKENEPIYDDLQKCGIGFRSLCPAEHRFWPIGRGLYVNAARTQSILVNEYDHLRFVCKESSGEFGMAYGNLVNLIHKIDDKLNFDWSEKYGWLTINPFNIGSSIRCKVRIRYAGATEALEKFCKLNDIQLVISNENDAQIVEVTNGKVFELSEFDCLKLFYENLMALIEIMANGIDEKSGEETGENPEENGNDGKSPNHSIEEISEVNIENEEHADVNDKVETPADENAQNAENEMNEGVESSIIGENNIGEACDEQTDTKDEISEANEAVADTEGAVVGNSEVENEESQQNEEVSKDGIPDEEAPNAEASNGGASNEEALKEEASNEESTKEEAPNEQTSNEDAPNEQAPEEQTPNEEAPNE